MLPSETQLNQCQSGGGSAGSKRAHDKRALGTLLTLSRDSPLAPNNAAAGSDKQGHVNSLANASEDSNSDIMSYSLGRKRRWSPEEEEALVHAHITEGNRWGTIAQRLPGGRTHLEIKVGWICRLPSKCMFAGLLTPTSYI